MELYQILGEPRRNSGRTVREDRLFHRKCIHYGICYIIIIALRNVHSVFECEFRPL